MCCRPFGWKRFRKDEGGATIVEFALVASLLFMMLFFIVEFSLIWLTSAMLENALLTASRFAKTNYSYSGPDTPDYEHCANLSRDDTVRCTVRRLSNDMINPQHIVFTTRIAGKNWGSADLGSQTSGTGGKQDIVIYEASYDWELINPFARPFFPGGKYVIRASTLTQNEQ